MADEVKVKWKNGCWYEIRRMQALIDIEETIAEDVAARANQMAGSDDGFKTGSRQGAKKPQGRWRTSVVAASPHAARHNAIHNTLIKALEAGA